MKKLFSNAKTIVCIGSGGVGKTTIAATLGLLAAQQGIRVLVLTIDPSQRLKTTLNLSDSGEISEVRDSSLQQSGGHLFAGVINAKKTFDEFVKKATKLDEVAARILKNKLYIQLSTTLSGSQEFTALEKLLSESESKNYDLIILDTPPSKHAIDFLRAPQKLSALFHEGIAKWFRNPEVHKTGIMAGLLHSGTKQVLRILETLTGSEFMHQLADFFNNIHSWQGQLEERVSSVHRLLISPRTEFFLVTAFDQAKLKEAEYLGREIKKDGYHLSAIIMNRAYPNWLDLRQASSPVGEEGLAQLYHDMKKYFLERGQIYNQFVSRLTGVTVIRLPELDEDIANLGDVANFAKVMSVEMSMEQSALKTKQEKS